MTHPLQSHPSGVFRLIGDWTDQIRRRHESSLGRSRNELATPSLILDLAIVQENIDAMAAYTSGHVKLRPHAKAHWSPEIAQRQVAAGAIGLTCATVSEAIVMSGAGLDGLLIANEILSDWKLDLLAAISKAGELFVAIDSPEGADALSSAAIRAKTELGAVIDVDLGMGRGGVRAADEARSLARYASSLVGVRVRGVIGWEGHVALEQDRTRRAAAASSAVSTLASCADALHDVGIDVDIVSAGGTNTYDITGRDPRVTEIEAGSYVLMDTSYQLFSPQFKPALTVLGTVTGRHDHRIILDCGSKTHAVLVEPPRSSNGSAIAVEVHEEHALVDVSSGKVPSIGDKVELLVSYCSGTVALNEVYHVVEGDRVVDIWPIVGPIER